MIENHFQHNWNIWTPLHDQSSAASIQFAKVVQRLINYILRWHKLEKRTEVHEYGNTVCVAALDVFLSRVREGLKTCKMNTFCKRWLQKTSRVQAKVTGCFQASSFFKTGENDQALTVFSALYCLGWESMLQIWSTVKVNAPGWQQQTFVTKTVCQSWNVLSICRYKSYGSIKYSLNMHSNQRFN